MKIFIPTAGRVDVQRTVKRLPREVLRSYGATFVCPPGEVRSLTSRYGLDALPCKKEGIAATRQFILDFMADERDPVALMLDDDLSIWRQREKPGPDGVVKYHKASDAEIHKGFMEIRDLLSMHVHGSIGHALFCQNHDPIYYNSRMLRALAYNARALKDEKCRFRLPVMEDFDMQLQLMNKGLPCAIYNKLVQDQQQNNSPGGCSGYRTLEVQAAAAHELADKWPGVVTVVTKAPKREWIGMGKERTDVRVNWRRALRTIEEH